MPTQKHPFRFGGRATSWVSIRAAGDAQWLRPRSCNWATTFASRGARQRDDRVIDLREYVAKGTDSLGRPVRPNGAMNSVPLDCSTAWLIGFYVAEGSASPMVQFSLGPHESDLASRAQAAVPVSDGPHLALSHAQASGFLRV